MKKFLLLVALTFAFSFSIFADRIFIVNAPGYNQADPNILAAIVANGHTVVISPSLSSLPIGFTSTCVDPVSGYDWLCFFGPNDFTSFSADVVAFMATGGKVYCQYEVSCCTASSLGTANILSAATGLSIVTNAADYVALGSASTGGWQAVNLKGCVTFTGNAYKGLDGVPVANQLQATVAIGSATPPISTCLNFGFFFPDIITPSTVGAICGMGDINVWFDGEEPANPVNPAVVDFFFPNCATSCYLFPTGCINGVSSSFVLLGNDTTLCLGDSLTLDVTSAGSTYLWQDGSTGSTFNVTSSGNYWVTVSQGACNQTDSINVAYISDINLNNDTTLCPGDVVTLNPGTPGASYLWQNGSTASTFNVTSPGLYWVEVDAGTCVSRDSIVIAYGNYNPIGNDTLLCQGQSLLLDVSNPGTTYSWQDGSTFSTFNVTSAGLYWVQENSGGCTYTDSIVISYNFVPDIGNDTTLCPGQNLILNATTTGGIYNWQNSSTAATFTVSTPGLFWVQVTQGTCTSADSINVAYLSNLNLGNDTALCISDTLILSTSLPGAMFSWQDGSTGSSYSVTSSGTYWLVATIMGCSLKDTVVITYPVPLNLGSDTIICSSDSFVLNASPTTGTYLWQNGATSSSIVVSTEGTYWVQINDYCGIRTDSIFVDETSLPTVTFFSNFDLCTGQTILLTANAENGTFNWQDGSSSNSFLVNQAGQYWVVASNSCGIDSDSVMVTEIDCFSILTMPSVFTPNSDGDNDNFIPIQMENITFAELQIYNRWGQLLFVTNNLDSGWDGQSNGKECADGTYFWILEYSGKLSEKTILKGFLSLLR